MFSYSSTTKIPHGFSGGRALGSSNERLDIASQVQFLRAPVLESVSSSVEGALVPTWNPDSTFPVSWSRKRFA